MATKQTQAHGPECSTCGADHTLISLLNSRTPEAVNEPCCFGSPELEPLDPADWRAMFYVGVR